MIEIFPLSNTKFIIHYNQLKLINNQIIQPNTIVTKIVDWLDVLK